MRSHPVKKPELLLRMDAAVAMQKAAAFRIASALGAAFLPVQGKRSFVGWLVPRAVGGVAQPPVRMEVRCRDFPSTTHTSSLIEKRVDQLLGKERTLYCEAFADGVAVVYDLLSVRNLLVWEELGMASVTVQKTGRKVKKMAAHLPYAMGTMLRMGEDVNRDPSAPSNDITAPPVRPVPLF